MFNPASWKEKWPASNLTDEGRIALLQPTTRQHRFSLLWSICGLVVFITALEVLLSFPNAPGVAVNPDPGCPDELIS